MNQHTEGKGSTSLRLIANKTEPEVAPSGASVGTISAAAGQQFNAGIDLARYLTKRHASAPKGLRRTGIVALSDISATRCTCLRKGPNNARRCILIAATIHHREHDL
ncbi:MAG: hypothetical protein SFU86_00395 [Pirellulaceae bacterium]|nr:hypothetical protein [Pirellulaceae bacterium]